MPKYEFKEKSDLVLKIQSKWLKNFIERAKKMGQKKMWQKATHEFEENYQVKVVNAI